MLSSVLRKIGAGLFLILVVGFAVYIVSQRGNAAAKFPAAADASELHEALYYEAFPDGTVRCLLCPNHCVLAPDRYGICKARKNIGGKLYSMVYGRIGAAHVDPVEKKPFFHVLPASKSYSIATAGCNMRCLFCQNWQLAQSFPDQIPSVRMTPAQVVDEAIRTGSESISFTYNEPVINYEFMLETAKIAKEKGITGLVVSAGFIEEKPLRELLQYIDAYKVDLKAFNEDFYRKLTGGRLESVLKTLQIIRESGVWLEILNLLVPGENDGDEEIRALARWIRENLGDDVPLHFSRFFPQYKLQNLPPTPVATLIRARNIAMEEGLKYVYTGNVAYPDGEATHCPASGEKIIQRVGHSVLFNKLKNGACPDGEKISGIWS
jgi:pyruvate formate lyase activating enzyme